MPESALQNWKKVVVRLVCFCFPWIGKKKRLKAAACAGESTKEKKAHVDGHDWKVNVVEQLVVIFHRHAGREEDHQLLLAVLLQKGEEQKEPLL